MLWQEPGIAVIDAANALDLEEAGIPVEYGRLPFHLKMLNWVHKALRYFFPKEKPNLGRRKKEIGEIKEVYEKHLNSQA